MEQEELTVMWIYGCPLGSNNNIQRLTNYILYSLYDIYGYMEGSSVL